MNKLQTILGMLYIIFMGVMLSDVAAAACDQAMLNKLLNQGFTKQILALWELPGY
jgi:hypothetical protein